MAAGDRSAEVGDWQNEHKVSNSVERVINPRGAPTVESIVQPVRRHGKSGRRLLQRGYRV